MVTKRVERAPSPAFWQPRRVLVTGGAGFLGSHIVQFLDGLGCQEVFVPRRSEYDLVSPEDVRRCYEDSRPDIVIHLAAVVGGIGANRTNPGRFFYDNLLMGVQMIEEGRARGVKKFVQLGTICAYPKHTPVPFREEELWKGYPDETNAPYGIAKKALLVQLQAYRTQYGLNGIYLLPVNLYGPRDNFDLDRSHVIPALIRKMVTALEEDLEEVTIWGTGKPSREFLHVEDCARAVVLAAERYDEPEPVNLGTGMEIRIEELARLIAEKVGYRGQLVYDRTKPDGQPRRCVDTSRALALFGFRSHITFEEGIADTISWYLRQDEPAVASVPSSTARSPG
jgi:GDP-L-fucose synthase